METLVIERKRESFDDELFHLCDSASSYSGNVAPSDNDAELDGGQLGVEFWKTKYEQLEEHCKVMNEQKVSCTLCIHSTAVTDRYLMYTAVIRQHS